ncbi:MAG TPA: hypothetical protein VFK52_13130 [Nocardioidaceae bacterium]|nr:hypothetical protein [Nocardioidaceae bacterium]
MRRTLIAVGLVSGLLTVPQPALQAAGIVCNTFVAGVTPDRHILFRDVTNRRVYDEIVSEEARNKMPTAMTYYGARDEAGKRLAEFDVYVPSTRTRRLQASWAEGGDAFSVKELWTESSFWYSKVAASSGTYYVYGVDYSGRLRQWTRYRNDRRSVFVDTPKTIARNMGGIKTLVFNHSRRFDGVRVDVLYGTTRKGALLQFRIPWRKPENAKITTIRRTGFAKFTGLSTSSCNRTTDHLSIIAINAKANTAKWFTMRNQMKPSGKNLVNRGLIAKDADWRITAVS